jgi:hypothetical protein
MIDLSSGARSPSNRSPAVTFSDVTGWPQKGQSISVMMTASGQARKIEGVVVALEPRTAVSPGRLTMQDSATGVLIDLPAPIMTQD